MHFHVIALPYFTAASTDKQHNPSLTPHRLDFGQQLVQNQNFIEAKTFGMSAENVFWGRPTKTTKTTAKPSSSD